VFRRHIGGNNELVLLSVKVTSEGGGPVNGIEPSISDSGTKIAWTNHAGQPPQTTDTNGKADVYVRDVTAGTTDMASRQSAGGGLSDGASGTPALSGDGTTVAFRSEAKNLDGDDTDVSPDIYVRFLSALQTRLVSVSGPVKGTESTDPSISRDGEIVAFRSAGKLDQADPSATPSAYAKNVRTGAVHLVSRGDGDAGPSSPASAGAVSVSGDGKKLTVVLERGTVVPGADPLRGVVALRDIAATPQRTSLVSRPSGSDPFVNAGGTSGSAQLNADGRYAAFATKAPGLGLPAGMETAIVVRDRVTGEVTVANRADGPNGAYLLVSDQPPAISADGRRVAFQVQGTFNEVWVRDIVANRSWLASRADGANGAPANAVAGLPHLDGDGSRVVFYTKATNLQTPPDTDAFYDVFVRDVDADRTFLVSRATGENGAKGNGSSYGTDISDDGQRVLIRSEAKNLDPADTDAETDVFVRDLATQTTVLAGVAPDGTQPAGSVDDASFDATGTRIAFETEAQNLLGITNPSPKIFLRDLQANTLEFVSRVGLDGGPFDGPTTNPTVSPDGKYLAFRGIASSLPGSSINQPQIYLRDLQTGRTELVSRAAGADGRPVSGRVNQGPSVTSGGGCVSFHAEDDLFGGHTDFGQVYVRALRADCAPTDPEPGPGPGAGAGGGPGGGAGPGGQGTDGGGRDAIAPVLTAARLKPSRIRIGKRSVLSFRSTEAATLTLTYERVRGKRRKRAGSTTHKVKVGSGRITVAGRVGRKRLATGKYRVTLVARDAAGNRSKPVRLSLTIVKKKTARR
jgi:Tol biopolymer transport system component